VKHHSSQLWVALRQVKTGLVIVSLSLTLALVALSGCTLLDGQSETGDSAESPAEHVEEIDPAAASDSSSEPVSEDMDSYSLEEEQLIYYGEVLAYRHGVTVSPNEWLSVAEKDCDSYSEADSTRVYGPASADDLDADPRSGFLLESFVFMVIGSYWCGGKESSAKIESYGSEAQLISLAFMATVVDNESINLSVADFSNYYDDQLFIARKEYAPPAEPDYSIPSAPDLPGTYDSSDGLENETPENDETDPSYPYPDRYHEHAGNSGGPTMCDDGTVSQSSGQGTCSWHGGEH
jgi:hypothetical protein